MLYQHSTTRGGTEISWHLARGCEPSLDDPAYWEHQADRYEELRQLEDVDADGVTPA